MDSVRAWKQLAAERFYPHVALKAGSGCQHKHLSMKLPRLKKRKDFIQIAQKGKRHVTDAFILQYLWKIQPPAADLAGLPAKETGALGDWRIGFTVTKKIGSAVIRNRVRRRLRAAADLMMPKYGHAGIDYVMIARDQAKSLSFIKMAADLKKVLGFIQP
jgi:ribonuclease P protein component